MNQERLEKARQSRERAKAERAGQTIEVAPYRIVRIDEYNWQIQGPKLSRDGNYYGNIVDALKALPAKLLNETACDSLAVVLAQHKLLIQKVERAVEQARLLGVLR